MYIIYIMQSLKLLLHCIWCQHSIQITVTSTSYHAPITGTVPTRWYPVVVSTFSHQVPSVDIAWSRGHVCFSKYPTLNSGKENHQPISMVWDLLMWPTQGCSAQHITSRCFGATKRQQTTRRFLKQLLDRRNQLLENKLDVHSTHCITLKKNIKHVASAAASLFKSFVDPCSFECTAIYLGPQAG